jgi:hypothetical protein
MKSAVIGQTGKTVLSDDAIWFPRSRRRTLRYRYVKSKVGDSFRYRAEVIGPFHSRLYGVCSYGTTKTRAKAELQLRLANDYRYLGHLMFSDVDESDIAGLSAIEIWHKANNIERAALGNAIGVPIRFPESYPERV